MFEQSPSEIPSSSIWASMNSWFTPAVFFVLLNIMIGTIAFTSTLTNKKQNQPTNQNQHQNEETHNQPKPSVLQRLKSTNFYPYFNRSQDTRTLSAHKQTPDSFNSELQTHYFFQENLQASQSQPTNYIFEQTHELNNQESQTHFVFEQKDPDLGDSKRTHLDSDQKDPDLDGSKQTHLVFEQKDSSLDGFEQAQEEKIEENEADEQSMDEVYSQLAGSHFVRTKSDTKPTAGEIPVKLPARMRKSASLKSPFGHFEEEKIVEARRPATVRERRGNNAKTAEGDHEVDARADDFINKFKEQLKLQRLDSIIRYKDTIGKGSVGR
ncbi:hypothetical protein STAS_08159 [Striga asiatica]|uniref:DUF4408 domain-containing protein n=1 Tax=Striga asiatica TaxID=4170 RepID=A0A5A7PHC1_STRAF|nr:hypothetical protein STAS_08159 [Striga asiatica]